MPNSELSKYKEKVIKQLARLSPLLQKYAMGDFSKKIPIPQEENEFTELLVGLNLMVDDIKELINEKQETINQLTQTEEELQKSMEQFRTFSEASPVGVFATDLNGNPYYWNTYLSEITGMSTDEIKKEGWLKAIHPEDEEMVFEKWKKSVKRQSNYELEHRFIDRHNKITWGVVKAVPLKDSNGNLIGYFGTISDITNRVQMEKLMQLQKNLAISLATKTSLKKTLETILITAFQLEEVDSGGIYLVDEKTGAVNLIVNQGLPQWFVDMVRHFDSDDPRVKLVMEGKPIYQNAKDYPSHIGKELKKEEILSLAVIPIKYGKKVIGAINLASHTHNDISDESKKIIETITQIELGAAIIRVKAEEEVKGTMNELEKSNRELEEALAKVKTLSGLIPICSICKKIRDDEGYWNLLESYLKEHSDVEFTHGLCPGCTQDIYSSGNRG